MATHQDNELSIRSRYGLLRDLVPIYSLYQLLLNLIAIGLVLWLYDWLGHFPVLLIPLLMLGWVFQFVLRPSLMIVSTDQAAWLEAVLEAQGYFAKSETDARWRIVGKKWWQLWPHHFIEFVTGDMVTVIAPREVMVTLRGSLELVEEHGEWLFSSDGQPFVVEPPEPEPEPELPWQTKVPTRLLVVGCVVSMVWTKFTGGPEGLLRWGLSAKALSEGHLETIFLHMFAHGSVMHLTMNMFVLAAIGPSLTSRLGPVSISGLRFGLLFFLSALAGATTFLVLNPFGAVPMVGASGGIYGLIGLMIRTSSDGGDVLAVRSKRVQRICMDLIKQNAFLFLMLASMVWASGGSGGLAWEAHLGGFLFGLFIGPKLLPHAGAEPSESVVPTK